MYKYMQYIYIYTCMSIYIYIRQIVFSLHMPRFYLCSMAIVAVCLALYPRWQFVKYRPQA